jgi:acyl-coenzyme A thioesterase PaaI-like protein
MQENPWPIRLLQNRQGHLRPWIGRLLLNCYLPFRGAGIRTKVIAPDYRYIRVELPLTWLNRNYVGTQFGGSIYAMTDPFYMFMLMQILGSDYIVWDKAARIDFIKPGRSRLIAEFRFTRSEIDEVIARSRDGQKYIFDKEVSIHDRDGLLIAKVVKTLYVRKKDRTN